MSEIIVGNGFWGEMLVAWGVSGVIIFLVTVLAIGPRCAFLVSLFKSSIPFLYVGWFWNNNWSGGNDDYKFIMSAFDLFGNGFAPIVGLLSFDLSPFAAQQWKAITFWNGFAMAVFGVNYFSTLFLNVISSAVVGVILYRTAIEVGFERSYSKWLCVFFLIHWDVISWTSFVSLKEPLSLVLVSSIVMSIVMFLKYKSILSVVASSLLMVIIFELRFYMLAVILLSFCLFLLVGYEFKLKNKFLSIFGFGASVAVLVYVVMHVADSEWMLFRDILFRFWEWPFFALKWLLQPRPWSVSEEYTFLSVASFLNWLFLPLFVFGGWLLWRENMFSRLFVVLIIVSSVFFGMFGFGPRHRFQEIFVVVWMQFHAIWCICGLVSPIICEKYFKLSSRV